MIRCGGCVVLAKPGDPVRDVVFYKDAVAPKTIAEEEERVAGEGRSDLTIHPQSCHAALSKVRRE